MTPTNRALLIGRTVVSVETVTCTARSRVATGPSNSARAHRAIGTFPVRSAALSGWVGRPVRLVAATASDPGRAEYFADATDDSSEAIEWTMPVGRYVDAAAVLLLTTASLRRGAELYPDGTWDVRRFRPNVLVALGGVDAHHQPAMARGRHRDVAVEHEAPPAEHPA